MRYGHPLTIPIVVDRSLVRSLPEQIATQVRAAVEDGTLPRGSRMPSTRALAEVLGVSRGVTAGAYDGLLRSGYLGGRRGSGTYVTAGIPYPVPVAPATRGVVDLRPGTPPREVFPLAAWRAAWRWASHQPPPVDAVPPLGLPDLRQALAGHVQRVYGINLTGRTVVVTSGVADGHRMMRAAGRPEVVVVHPAAVPPLPRPDGGAFLGGFAEVLTAHLCVGYAVIPADLAATLRPRPEPPAYLAQRVATRLLTDGVMERLILRCRLLHTQRRGALTELLDDLPDLAERWIPQPMCTGLITRTDARTATALGARGILVGLDRTGVVIGYAHLPPPDLRHALSRLDAALSARSA